MKIKEIRVKSILTKSKLPGADYVINPYIGCAFGCSYCYADFMRRFTGHTDEQWGEFVDVKVNAAEVLEKGLNRLVQRIPRLDSINSSRSRSGQGGIEPTVLVLFSSVTDPYQGVEAKYKITRKCLKVIAKSNFRGEVSILTKSPLVTRDIDIIKKLNASVGFTITTTSDKVSRLLEGKSPPASARLKALKQLNKAGISTYVCVNPLLPHFVASQRKLRKLFDAIYKTGNREIWLEHINLSGNKLKRIKDRLKQIAPSTIQYFEKAKTEKYKSDLNKLIYKILKDYDFKIGGGGIIDHKRHVIIVPHSANKPKTKSGWRIEVI